MIENNDNNNVDLKHKKNTKDLDEIRKEEAELLSSIHSIIYWTFSSHNENISKGHIIAQCKKLLHVLKKLTKEIDEKFVGPNTINTFTLTSPITNPRHLAQIHKDNTEIDRTIHAILTLVTRKEFQFSKENKEKIRNHTLKIINEIGAEEDELDIIFELIEDSNTLV